MIIFKTEPFQDDEGFVSTVYKVPNKTPPYKL